MWSEDIYFKIAATWKCKFKEALTAYLFFVRPRLWVNADCGKRHLFISMKHPSLTPFMKPYDVLYL